MGVLACDRNGCRNVMCDRASTVYGRICNECFEELKAHGPEQSITEFMEEARKISEADKDSYVKMLEQIFKLRD